MAGVGERQNGAIHPSFDRSISIDFKGAKITSDTGFLLMRHLPDTEVKLNMAVPLRGHLQARRNARFHIQIKIEKIPTDFQTPARVLVEGPII